MVINQRMLRVGAIVAVAGATGLVMQVRSPEALPLEAEAPTVASTAVAALPSESAPLALTTVETVSETLAPEASPSEPEAVQQVAALAPPANDGPGRAVPPVTTSEAAPNCSADMALVVQPGAMLDLGVISPCRPHQRVVIRHAGLAVTGLTSAAGTLIATLPALQSPAEVRLSFLDGTETVETAEVPDLARFDRFAIQWHDAEAFQLRAYPKGYDAGEAGVIAAASPGEVSTAGGYLMTLGNAEAPRPLLAEVFTWPAGEKAVDSAMKLSIEAAVTATTCARELLGETLQLSAGELTRRDFSIEMPDCAAVGEYVALPNPLSTEKLAVN